MVAKSFERDMKAGGIDIVTKVRLNPSTIVTSDFDLSYKTLRAVDARYIVIIASAALTADFYYKSNNYSLIAANIVWIGWNVPWPNREITDEETELLQGFIFPNPDDPSFSSPPIVKFGEAYQSIYDASKFVD
ncbi:hypothetical protein HDU76_011481 [Blyttiomyces sp. JEL0837]|nr:hypothetical protein HDU76_011481 [Blyttiomyces sp. JEL0837]